MANKPEYASAEDGLFGYVNSLTNQQRESLPLNQAIGKLLRRKFDTEVLIDTNHWLDIQYIPPDIMDIDGLDLFPKLRLRKKDVLIKQDDEWMSLGPNGAWLNILRMFDPRLYYFQSQGLGSPLFISTLPLAPEQLTENGTLFVDSFCSFEGALLLNYENENHRQVWIKSSFEFEEYLRMHNYLNHNVRFDFSSNLDLIEFRQDYLPPFNHQKAVTRIIRIEDETNTYETDLFWGSVPNSFQKYWRYYGPSYNRRPDSIEEEKAYTQRWIQERDRRPLLEKILDEMQATFNQTVGYYILGPLLWPVQRVHIDKKYSKKVKELLET